MIRGEDREIGRLAGRDGSLSPENTRRAAGKKLDHAGERQASRVNELQGQRQSGLESGNAERRAIEFDFLRGRLMRRMIGGDRIHGSVGEPCDQRGPVLRGRQGRIHLETRIVDHIFVA